MSDAKYYKPKAQPGDVLYIVDNKKYYLVEEVEALGTYIKDFGALANGNTLEYQELDALYPPKGWIAEFRILPVDDIRVKIRIAREAVRGAMEKVTYYIDKWIADNIWYHTLAEVWCLHDMKFYIDITNASGTDLTTTRIRIVGWAYKVREIAPHEAEGKRIVRVRVYPMMVGER